MLTVFKEMFGELSAWGKFWLYLGLATLACAAAMSFAFGLEISWKHALFLTCLTAVAAFLPGAVYTQWEQGRTIVAVILAIIAVPTQTIEFYTHAGYTAGLRGSNIETAMVQNAKWTGSQEAVVDDKTNLAMWRAQLAKLKEQHAWAGTVKAEGLRAQLEAATKAVELEAARGGCKTRCLAEMKKKADIEERISIAEEASNLESRIEATQRILDKKRDTAATTEHKSSAVDLQNRFLAKVVAFVGAGSLKPTELMTEGAEQTVNLAMALAGTGLPALALFIAGLYRRQEDRAPSHAKGTPPHRPSTHETHTVAQPIILTNKALREWAEKHMPQLKVA